jgi:8-oxo-dGTP pyrophosphatase MutT (NUDIX family)
MESRKKAGVILVNNQKILLVKGIVKWSFPKGTLEQSESCINCAKREFQEETGFKLKKSLDPTNVINSCNCLYYVLEIEMSDLVETENIPDPTEIVLISWFHLKQIPDLNINCGVKSSIPKLNNKFKIPLIPPGFEEEFYNRLYLSKKKYRKMTMTDINGWSCKIKRVRTLSL